MRKSKVLPKKCLIIGGIDNGPILYKNYLQSIAIRNVSKQLNYFLLVWVSRFFVLWTKLLLPYFWLLSFIIRHAERLACWKVQTYSESWFTLDTNCARNMFKNMYNISLVLENDSSVLSILHARNIRPISCDILRRFRLWCRLGNNILLCSSVRLVDWFVTFIGSVVGYHL